MTVVINSGSSGELNPGFGGNGGPVATAISTVRTTSISATIGGSSVDALSGQVSYGYDKVAGEARIVMPALQGSDVGQSVSVSMMSTTRFQGTVRQIDYTLFPHAVSLLCKGPLYAIEEYKNPTTSIASDEGQPGLDFETLVSASSATLRTIITKVLDTVGVTYTLANLDNPTHTYGLIGPEVFTFRLREIASAYIHRVLEASELYRLFDSSDGNVYMRQITAVPSGTPDFTFTLGQDIFGNSTAQNSSLGQRTAVLVTGYDDGSGPATSGIVGTGTNPFEVNSELIEDDTFATSIANLWLNVVNRRQQVVRLSTPRTDLLGPGQTIYVDAAGGLSVSQQLWLKSVTTEMAPNGQFTQHLTCVAGA